MVDAFRNETERISNRYSATAMSAVFVALFIACILNEMGVFEVDKTTTWGCLLLAFIIDLITIFLSRNERTSCNSATKYVIIVLSLLLILVTTITLNISVELLLLLPMLLAPGYRNMKVSTLSIIGSSVVCVVYPIIAWLANSWSLNILSGYLETTCKVSIVGYGASMQTVGETIFKLLVFLSLPQLMAIIPFGIIILRQTDNNIKGMRDRIQVAELNANLEHEISRIMSMQDQVLYAMAEIIENRDDVTGGHVKRTSRVVEILVNKIREGGEIDLPDDMCLDIIKAAPLHDLGKISVDDAVLKKSERLSPQERALINKHPEKSAELIRSMLVGLEDDEFLETATNIALYHHEWYDGSGYPTGKQGEEIPIEARIMAIADVYDALVSKRSYKEAIKPGEAFELIQELMGKQFDPALGRYFVEAFPQIIELYNE